MWYDVIILAILGLAILRGAIKGFVWQLASIAALVLSFVFAERFSLIAAPYIGVEPPLNRWIAMLTLYVLFSFLSFAVARGLHGWIEKAKLVEYDRHLGSLFGFVKGVTFCLVLTFFVVTLSERGRARVLESHSGYLAAIIMDRLHPVMPTELHKVLEPFIHKLDREGLDLHHAHHAADDDDGRADHHGRAYADDHSGAEEDKPPENDWRKSEHVRLLREISAVYADFPDAQAAIVEEIEAVMTGIPDQVVLAVLRDWRADFSDRDPDPDPQTDVATSLDARIVRQMEISGVPLTSLSRGLQDRLRESLTR